MLQDFRLQKKWPQLAGLDGRGLASETYSMKNRTFSAITIIIITVLSGCATPPPGPLILTQEDLRLKQTGPECPEVTTQQVETRYSSK